jgi:hypothetical protein
MSLNPFVTSVQVRTVVIKSLNAEVVVKPLGPFVQPRAETKEVMP